MIPSTSTIRNISNSQWAGSRSKLQNVSCSHMLVCSFERQNRCRSCFRIELDTNVFVILDELAKLFLQLLNFVLGFTHTFPTCITVLIELVMFGTVFDDVLLDRISYVGSLEGESDIHLKSSQS